MLQEKLQKDLVKAMKEGNTNKKEALSFLLSRIKNKAIELKMRDTGINDAEAVAIIQKMMKEIAEEIAMYKTVGRMEIVELKQKQITILNSYLPRMLTDIEIRAEIDGLEDKTLPSIMKYFKLNFAGRVDMGMVSKIARDSK